MIAAVVASFAFGAQVTNAWFPLRPGDRYVYVGFKDGKRARDVVTVENATRINTILEATVHGGVERAVLVSPTHA